MCWICEVRREFAGLPAEPVPPAGEAASPPPAAQVSPSPAPHPEAPGPSPRQTDP